MKPLLWGMTKEYKWVRETEGVPNFNRLLQARTQQDLVELCCLADPFMVRWPKSCWWPPTTQESEVPSPPEYGIFGLGEGVVAD